MINIDNTSSRALETLRRNPPTDGADFLVMRDHTPQISAFYEFKESASKAPPGEIQEVVRAMLNI